METLNENIDPKHWNIEASKSRLWSKAIVFFETFWQSDVFPHLSRRVSSTLFGEVTGYKSGIEINQVDEFRGWDYRILPIA